MDASLFVRGLVIGFSIAAVVGPIGILCIQRTLEQGFLSGFVTGLGAATADATYGSIAAFGLTIISGFLVGQQLWIRLLGGLFLIYLGFNAIRKPLTQRVARASGTTFLALYLSTLLLTLTNPLTILSFAAIFATLGVGIGRENISVAALVVAGVFAGSTCWWLILSGGVGLLRERLTPRWLLWIKRSSGIVLVISGIIALISLFW